MPSAIPQLRCPECGAHRTPGLLERIELLRGLGMLRQEAKPDKGLVDELLRVSAHRLHCPTCRRQGLAFSTVEDEEQNDEAWGMARKCDDCGAAIPSERLELFPQTRLCVGCQGRDERGESPPAVEYCPRCGSVMTLARSTSGITRYRMACRSCGGR